MNGVFDRVLGQLRSGLTDMGNETDLIHRFAGCLDHFAVIFGLLSYGQRMHDEPIPGNRDALRSG